jgi:CzcA family heavy metal efflux pump
MLRAIVAFSIRRRGVVLALAIVLLVYGIYSAAHAKLDVFPEFVPPQVTIQSEAPGLSPEQVEALVTTPIEGVVAGVGDLETVRSQSVQGLAIVTAVFGEKTDILVARQMLGERLAELAGELPQGVKSPKMEPLTSSTMDLYKLGLEADATAPHPPTPMELRTYADWVVRPRLLAVPGVASVNVYGGQVRQLQVQVLPERLVAYDLTIDDVLAAARAATGVRGAGFVETPAQRIVLQTEGQALTAEQLGATVIKAQAGALVRLADVAHVVVGAQPKFGDAQLQGKAGVFVALLSQYGANTLEVTRAVEQALDDMSPGFHSAGILLQRGLFRPATFIETAVQNIGYALLLGGVFVALVLFAFLWNFRTALISLAAIPLSLLAAVIVLNEFGATLNTITLGGLAIAIGIVVDDAIIDVENVFRRLRENAAADQPRGVFQVVLEASLEVRSAVVYATFLVILVFVPVLMMTGMHGKLFAPLAVAYILAVLASLGAALTVTPALCMVLLPRHTTRVREPRVIAGLKAGYRRLLGLFVSRPLATVAPVLLLCAGAALLAVRLGGEFLPDFREGHFVTHLNAIPGTSLAESRRLGTQIAERLLQIPHVLTVPQQTGRAELGEDTWGPNRSEFHINITPNLGAGEDAVRDAIRDAFESIPGTTHDITTFLGDRISETISGETAAVVISLFGDNLDVLDAKAEAIRQTLTQVAGAVDVQVAAPPGAPQLVVKLHHARAMQMGLRPVDVLDAIQTAFQGATVAQTYEAGKVFDVVVILDAAHRREPEAVGDLLLRTPDGARVPLRAVAELHGTDSRYLLLHDGGRRRQTITCNVEGRDVASFVDAAKVQIAERVPLPAGMYTVFGGQAAARATAQRDLLVHSALAAVGILLLLWVVMGHVQNLLLVLVNLPFALVGGIVAVWLTRGKVSIGGLVGFVTLFGITTRNSIMMLSHYQHLVSLEGMTWGPAAALRGASERLVPILMTALVTGLGLLPIAVGSDQAGREIEGPMAVVILGGLATSTLLNLLVMPTLAVRFGRFERRGAEQT